MKVVNTSDWTFERLERYGKAITAAFAKLERRYSADVTVESLARDCLTGAKQLWLILDDDDALRAVFMTRISVVEATGVKICTVCDLAGQGFRQWWVEMADEVEAWAKSQGVQYGQIEGRRGWLILARKRGYAEYAVLFRKEL